MSKKRQTERLKRALVAVKTEKDVYIGWRLFGDDPENIIFRIYRNQEQVYETAIGESTNWIDPDGNSTDTYQLGVVIDNEEVQADQVEVWDTQYLSIPLVKPEDGVTPDGVEYTYHANDASVGDIDGDGEYEIILKWDPSNAKDNAHSGYTGNVYLDAYKLNGTHVWRIDLGKNIRAGAHYTQFMVYDLDGDGKAEIACKTADGTIDGVGKIIGDGEKDFRNERGFILEGPEYLTIFSGETGAALETIAYNPPRGKGADWGDERGNRVDRFLACIAYLDGERPSLVMCRGYYTRAVLAAYNYRDGKLENIWTFDSLEEGNEGYSGQGNHSVSVADVDGDGCDEIIYGACVIDHDGTGLYTTGLGHGDALHVGNLNPNREGIEIYQVHETPSEDGVEIRDAKTGEILWSIPSFEDVGRGLAANIDPRYPGTELWSSTHWCGANGALYSVTGEKISDVAPQSCNFAIWWDGDLLRELLDHTFDEETRIGIPKIDKWDYENGRLINLLTPDGTRSNNHTKGNPCLQADILGDWREEVIWRTEDSTALRVYTTIDYTDERIHTLMHDSMYRLAIAWQNTAYNQPPHPSFYIGPDMDKVPQPSMYYVTSTK